MTLHVDVVVLPTSLAFEGDSLVAWLRDLVRLYRERAREADADPADVISDLHSAVVLDGLADHLVVTQLEVRAHFT